MFWFIRSCFGPPLALQRTVLRQQNPAYLSIKSTGDDGSGSGGGDGSELDVGVEQLEQIIVEDFGAAWVDAYETTVRAFQVWTWDGWFVLVCIN